MSLFRRSRAKNPTPSPETGSPAPGVPPDTQPRVPEPSPAPSGQRKPEGPRPPQSRGRRDGGRRAGGRGDESRRDDGRRDGGRREEGRRDDGRREESRHEESRHDEDRGDGGARRSQAPAFTPLERNIHYFFRRRELLQQALTHSSFAYERQGQIRDNELLEFLGDSVIGLIAADFFFSSYEDTTEGDLSKLKSSASSTVALAEFAQQIKLDKYIQLGRGEERSGGRRKSTILAGVFEALLGAIYLDGGFEAARGVYIPLVESTFQKVHKEGYTVDNYKSALQEYLQKEDLPAPHYKTVSVSGPEHNKTFVVEVYSNRTALGKAKGPSRKLAEQRAAETALKSFMGRKIKSLTSETFIVKK